MIVSIQRATELTGLSRATISRHIKAGKLSRTDKGIDTSELVRCYGELKSGNDKSGTTTLNNSMSEREAWLMKQVEQLQCDMRELKAESLARESRLMALLENKAPSPSGEAGGLFGRLFK